MVLFFSSLNIFVGLKNFKEKFTIKSPWTVIEQKNFKGGADTTKKHHCVTFWKLNDLNRV